MQMLQIIEYKKLQIVEIKTTYKITVCQI